jgi:hypothetical protein
MSQDDHQRESGDEGNAFPSRGILVVKPGISSAVFASKVEFPMKIHVRYCAM